jgi:S1-C subfamily serine protease
VEGIACSQIQDGTGFVVGPDLVVTNAHVVAGESDTSVLLDDNRRVSGTVVAFDPDRDLAVIRAGGLDRPALPVVASSTGATGGVFGHPGGAPLRIAPFEVARQLTASAGTSTAHPSRREVLELKSSLRPGDSGSALVNAQGAVVGVAFAIARQARGGLRPEHERAAPVLRNLTGEVSTGPAPAGAEAGAG